MENNIEYELMRKVGKVIEIKDKVKTHTEKQARALDALEALDSFICERIKLAGMNDETGEQEEIILTCKDFDEEEITEIIKEKLEGIIRKYDDKMSEIYKELDELLK
jgi:hypothetical protein